MATDPKRSSAAALIGRPGGKRGGYARGHNLSPAARKALARVAVRARWHGPDAAMRAEGSLLTRLGRLRRALLAMADDVAEIEGVLADVVNDCDGDVHLAAEPEPAFAAPAPTRAAGDAGDAGLAAAEDDAGPRARLRAHLARDPRASPGELAQAIYGDSTRETRALVRVLLREQLRAAR